MIEVDFKNSAPELGEKLTGSVTCTPEKEIDLEKVVLAIGWKTEGGSTSEVTVVQKVTRTITE
ncbi:MAG: hypothetical protein ABEJ65_02630, partial [bacterium]